MSALSKQILSSFSGQFKDRTRERLFQASRFEETLRHTRLIFLGSIVLNSLFFVSDWRFFGTPQFAVAIPARALVVTVACLCLAFIAKTRTFDAAQRWMIVWQWGTGIGVAALVTSRSDIALLVVLMLPTIYYLAVPTSFFWSLIGGAGCSAMLLAGYLLSGPAGTTTVGLLLAMLVLNVVMILMVARTNRHQRLEWFAIQAERQANEELAESRTKFETLFKMVPLPLIVAHKDGRIVEMNDAATCFLGVANGDGAKARIDEFYQDPDDRRLFLDALATNGHVGSFETEFRMRDGSVRTTLLAGNMIQIGGVEYIMGGVTDITERKAAEERVWRATSHDQLTGLPNRAYFQTRLEEALSHTARRGSGLSLLLIDLDNLRTVNETLGHQSGDALIKNVASRLSLLLGSGDMAARLGGDEFVLLVSGSKDPAHAEALAGRVLEELRRPFPFGDGILSGEASIGIACFPGHGETSSSLMMHADLALQEAKAKGRNCAVVYAPRMKARIEQRATVARDIHEALRLGQIVPFYQPKIDLTTGQVVGFEALARWRHPDHGVLRPGFFSTVFDDPHLSLSIGDEIIKQVVADIRGWLSRDVDCGRIAVNLSTAQFDWVGIAGRVLDILAAEGVPASRLGVEVTETVILGRSAPHVSSALQEFHRNGIGISLDDFGTGYASLIHLKQFPVDDIKIDQTFVKDLETDSGSAAIIHAVIELGRNLGINVIAEGIETPAQAAFLRSKGCAHGQGDLYAQPMAAADVVQFLAASRMRCA